MSKKENKRHFDPN